MGLELSDVRAAEVKVSAVVAPGDALLVEDAAAGDNVVDVVRVG